MNRRVGMYQYLLMHIVTKYYFCFIEDDLEAALAKCVEVLSTFQIASSKNWETRMSNLTSSWDNIRKQLIEAVLSCEGRPSPDICSICLEGKVCIRFMECPKQFMCHTCSEKVHKSLPFHDRDTYVNGYFHAIPPTVGVDGKGYHQIIGNFTIYSVHFFKLLFSLHMLNYTFFLNHHIQIELSISK